MSESTAIETVEYPNPASVAEVTGVTQGEDIPLGEGEGEGEEVAVEVAPEEPKVQTEVVIETPPEAQQESVSEVIAKAKQREAAAREAEERARQAEERAKQKELSTDEILRNPTKTLQKLGISFEQLANAIIAEGEPEKPKDAGQLALEKAEALEKKLEAERKAQERAKEESEQNTINKAISDHKAIVNKVVDDSGEKYELIKAYGQQDLVTDIVIEYWKEHKKMLPMEEALEMAENYLYQRTEKALSAEKIKKKFVQASPPKESEEKQLARTLTNSMASAVDVEAMSGKRLSRDERLKRAASKIVIKAD